IGVVIVGIGRAQLIEFYTMTGRPEGQVLQARLDSVLAAHDRTLAAPKAENPGYAAIRQSLTATVLDTTLARGMRYSTLVILGLAPCTNVRELVFGPGRGMDTTFTRARRELARYPADSALIDLMQRAPERGVRGARRIPWYTRAMVGAARLSGWLLHSRRFGGCAEVLAAHNGMMNP
ncbi:MAG: hypothetical protein Q7J79_10800, partial [Gemmatimonadales bacterium]|nr:hypothetical protein [Gemmatimonadales bacterium]